MISRRGILGMLAGGAIAPNVIASKKLPQRNKFERVEKLVCRKLEHYEGYGDNAVFLRYSSSGFEKGLSVNRRCGLILTPEANTKAQGMALKKFGEMLIAHADHDYSKGE